MRLSQLAPWQRWCYGPRPWRRKNACWRLVDIRDDEAGLDAEIRVSVSIGESTAIRGPGHARMLAKLRQAFDGILADCATGADGADGEASPPGGDGRRRGSIDPAAMAGTGSAPRADDPAPAAQDTQDTQDAQDAPIPPEAEDREFDALYLGWMLCRAQASQPKSTPEELLAACIEARPDVTAEDAVTALETVRSMPDAEARLLRTIPLGLAAAPQYRRIRDRIRRKSPEELGINTDKMPPGWLPGDPLPSVAEALAAKKEEK